MKQCKKNIIVACFLTIAPIIAWSEAPVIDDSEHFAIKEGQQMANASVGHSKYDEVPVDEIQPDNRYRGKYSQEELNMDEGSALAKDDQENGSESAINDNANLIDKVQSLQQEIQELRGQLEVQAHDLKLLQQQQVAFYKDLDARIGGTSAKVNQSTKPATEITLGSSSKSIKKVEDKPQKTVQAQTKIQEKPKSQGIQGAVNASHANPADEQISYLAAYELIKNKSYDEGIHAMQAFIQKYPNGGYTANADYWLGEVYMVKKDYNKAIEYFESVLKQFPNSNKSAASMLKSGYAYAAIGNKEKAIERLNQVVKTYPDTSTAELASTRLKSLHSL